MTPGKALLSVCCKMQCPGSWDAPIIQTAWGPGHEWFTEQREKIAECSLKGPSASWVPQAWLSGRGGWSAVAANQNYLNLIWDKRRSFSLLQNHKDNKHAIQKGAWSTGLGNVTSPFHSLYIPEPVFRKDFVATSYQSHEKEKLLHDQPHQRA